MKLVIQQKRIISSLQQDFNILFPFLKIEFYPGPGRKGVFTLQKKPLLGTKSLEECRTVSGESTLVVLPRMSVRELQNEYLTIFGISIKVFRLSGKAWIETSITDEWTLKAQNEYGQELSERKKLEVA